MHTNYLLLLLVLIPSCTSDRIVISNIKRIGHRDYNFFPLCRNYLELTVKANFDVYIALSNTYDLNSAYYEILIDGYVVNGVGQKSEIRKDGKTLMVHEGSVLNQNGYQQFWVSMNETDESISFGKQRGNPILRFQDANFVRMSYFGLATPHRGLVEYSFDASTLLCLL